MADSLITWHVYEISSGSSSLNGVGLRGTIRKLALERGFNVISENTEDAKNGVRFAVLLRLNIDILLAMTMSIFRRSKTVKTTRLNLGATGSSSLSRVNHLGTILTRFTFLF